MIQLLPWKQSQVIYYTSDVVYDISTDTLSMRKNCIAAIHLIPTESNHNKPKEMTNQR